MKRIISAVSVIAAMAVATSAMAQTGGDPRRDQARSLAASGNFAEALKLYDNLTAAGSTDVALYTEATRAAVGAHDLRRAAVYAERRMKIDPNDYNTHAFVPLAYRLGGDEAEAKRTRAEFVSYWKASTDPKVRSQSLFLIDTFRAGPWTVNALQCFEIGGDFGVGYVFDVWGPKAPPLPPDQVAANYRERIVLEHNRLDKKMASEIAGRDVPVRPTLDVLRAGGHATLKWFDGEPPYATLRDIVEQYVANDTDLAIKPPIGGTWNRITCRPASE